MEDLPGSLRRFVVQLHISAGMTVLVLTFARVVWRLLNPPPPFVSGMTRLETFGAKAVHLGLYAAMIAMPLSGWAIVSARPPERSPGAIAQAVSDPFPAGRPPRAADGSRPSLLVWFLAPLPAIPQLEQLGKTEGGVAPQEILHDELADYHALGSFILIALLLLHVGGALKHQWFDRQPELARMWWRRRKRQQIDQE